MIRSFTFAALIISLFFNLVMFSVLLSDEYDLEQYNYAIQYLGTEANFLEYSLYVKDTYESN